MSNDIVIHKERSAAYDSATKSSDRGNAGPVDVNETRQRTTQVPCRYQYYTATHEDTEMTPILENYGVLAPLQHGTRSIYSDQIETPRARWRSEMILNSVMGVFGNLVHRTLDHGLCAKVFGQRPVGVGTAGLWATGCKGNRRLWAAAFCGHRMKFCGQRNMGKEKICG